MFMQIKFNQYIGIIPLKKLLLIPNEAFYYFKLKIKFEIILKSTKLFSSILI